MQAWHEQDETIRPYKDFFKPVMCVLEGTWLEETSSNLVEPFESERNFLDVASYVHLHKVRGRPDV